MIVCHIGSYFILRSLIATEISLICESGIRIVSKAILMLFVLYTWLSKQDVGILLLVSRARPLSYARVGQVWVREDGNSDLFPAYGEGLACETTLASCLQTDLCDFISCN